MIPAILAAAIVLGSASLATAATPACTPATVDKWTHASPNLSTVERLAILPVKPCLMQSETGAHTCSRKIGCLNDRR